MAPNTTSISDRLQDRAGPLPRHLFDLAAGLRRVKSGVSLFRLSPISVMAKCRPRWWRRSDPPAPKAERRLSATSTQMMPGSGGHVQFGMKACASDWPSICLHAGEPARKPRLHHGKKNQKLAGRHQFPRGGELAFLAAPFQGACLSVFRFCLNPPSVTLNLGREERPNQLHRLSRGLRENFRERSGAAKRTAPATAAS